MGWEGGRVQRKQALCLDVSGLYPKPCTLRTYFNDLSATSASARTLL